MAVGANAREISLGHVDADGDADALVAYVSWEDGAGNRAVLTEAGEVKVMNKQEFDAAQKR